MANASGGPDNITAIIIQVSDQDTPAPVSSAQQNKNLDDTNPSLKINRKKPHTLPEGKYHTDKNLQ
jgi:serine/threonine protein phosphatase PrpC